MGLHFAASGRLLDRDVETTTDPILAARRTVNGLLVSVAGLIAVAVGNELVIAHPQSQVSMALSLVLFGGPSSWSSPSFVTACDFKLAPHAPAGLTAMPIDRPGLRCQYLSLDPPKHTYEMMRLRWSEALSRPWDPAPIR